MRSIDTQYERTAVKEPCVMFEFASSRYDHHYKGDPNTRGTAFRWFEWFKACGISAMIERRDHSTGPEYVVWREGPRWKMQAQKPSREVVTGTVIAYYDEKGVFAERKAG